MNDTKQRRLHATLRILFAVTATLAMLLQIAAFLTSVEANTNYYENGSVFPILSAGFALLAAAIGSVDAFVFPPRATMPAKRIGFATLPSAIGFAVAGIHLLLMKTTTLGMICAILLLAAAIYCVLDLFNLRQYDQALACLGFTGIIGCMLLTGYHYFDSTIEMNAPCKVLLQIALLCAMLFFTSEVRFKMNTPAPRLSRMLCTWMIASGAIAALPMIFAYLFGTIDRADYLTGAILILGVTVTAAIRLVSLYTGASDETAAEPEDDTTDTTI